jgi:methyltransferase (TIGR00027 family)
MRAGSASETAQRVAAHRLSFRRVPFGGGRPDDDERLHEDVAAGVVVDRGSVMARYLAARTAFVDGTVVAWLNGGGTQLVSVGAGYDGRALRYAARGARWFELDHPDTQADKVARLARLGIDVASIGFVADDFATADVPTALARAGHDASTPTLFTCEGVAGYLSPDVLTALLRSLATCAADGSRLALTLRVDAEAAQQDDAHTRLVAAVGAMGEPLASSIARAQLRPFLLDTGWRVERAVDPAGVDVEASERASAFVIASALTAT